MAKRKVGYYYLMLQQGEDNMPILDAFNSVIKYVVSKDKTDRLKDMLNNNVCFLEDFQTTPNHTNVYKILFKTAKHSYRAPLLNKNTATERENPKRLEEGELYKTHIVIDFSHDSYSAAVYMENAQNLLSMQQFVQYLNYFLNMYNDETEIKIQGIFTQYAIPRTDFCEALNNMSRVSIATLVLDKSIVGGEALNYSNQTEQAQSDVQLIIKAKRSESADSR